MLGALVLMLGLGLSRAFAPTGRLVSRDLAMMARKKKEMPPNPVAVGEYTHSYFVEQMSHAYSLYEISPFNYIVHVFEDAMC
jgi:hypothetical protein